MFQDPHATPEVRAQRTKREDATPEDIRIAGENALVCLYNGRPGDKIDTLWVQHFHRKVSPSTSCVQPQTLPSTLAAAKYHSLRVNHQVHQWRSAQWCATEWGWRLKDDKMSLVATDLSTATTRQTTVPTLQLCEVWFVLFPCMWAMQRSAVLQRRTS